MLQVDHIAVLGSTLEAATSHAETALGVALGPGGQHVRFGTHNRLLGLDDGLYLEAIAIDPAAAPPPDPRWFGLDHFTGAARIDKWICRVPDMTAALKVIPEAGRPISLVRGDLRWVMAVPEDGNLPFDGFFPALIEWQSAATPGDTLPQSGCSLQRLTLRHPQATALAARLGPHLSDPRITFQTADAPGIEADLTTPDGPRRLA